MLQRVERRRLGIDHRLYQRVRRQTVAAVQTRARALAQGVQALYRRLSVQVHLDTAAHVVRRGPNGDVVLGDVNAHRQTLLVDVREVVARLVGRLVRHVQADVVQTVNLHLLVDGPRHDVARSQREPLVVLLHERLAVRQFQHAAIAAHRLGDQIRRVRLLRVVQHRRVELHEFHVLHRRLRAVGHRDAVARGNDGVRRRQIHRAAAARAQHRHLGQICVHLLLRVQYVRPVAADVRRPPRHPHP